MTADEQIAGLRETVSLALDHIQKQCASDADLCRKQEGELNEEIATLRDRVKEIEGERDTAVRHEGMFRRALYIYLQERDGPAGTSAPTPETLTLIRQLVDELR